MAARFVVMGGGMDPIAMAAGTALVSAMATDSWQQVRTAFAAWWSQVRPDQEEAVAEALTESQSQLMAARRAQDVDTERILANSWQLRLQQLLRDDPTFADELRGLLDEVIKPALTAQEQASVASLMNATASGHGRVYQAGRDQHIAN